MNGMTAKTLFLMTLMDAAVFITNQKHCLPGHHPQHDTVTGETRCEECPVGMFSKKGRQCLLCSVCHQAQSEVRGCTRSGNRVCRCPPGTYLKKGAICAQCSTCTRGMVETHTCAHDMNRACRLCPSGHTTNANNERVCVRVPEHVVEPSQVVVQHVVDWWVILFVAAAVVALGGCVALVCWRFRRKKRARRNSVPPVRHSTLIRLAEMDDLSAGERLVEAEQVVRLEEEEDVSKHCMVRDLKADIYEELGVKLNNTAPRNWVYLAGLLGFTKDQVRSDQAQY